MIRPSIGWDDRLPEAAGVDVEHRPESGAQTPARDGDQERGRVGETDREQSRDHECAERDVPEAPPLPQRARREREQHDADPAGGEEQPDLRVVAA